MLYLTNILTGIRIICGVVLLFVPVFSPLFYSVYFLGGFTDMIDGPLARKTETTSSFGEKFDTIADTIFVLLCMIKLIPKLTFPIWIYMWVCIIAVIKLFSILYGFIVYQRFISIHTTLNKIAGVVLFILPFTRIFTWLNYGALFSCIVTTTAAVWEAFLTITRHNSKKY